MVECLSFLLCASLMFVPSAGLIEEIKNFDGIEDVAFFECDDIVIIAVITEPLIFHSDIQRKASSIMDKLKNYYQDKDVYVTRDRDIFHKIKKYNQNNDNNLAHEIIKLTKKRFKSLKIS